LKKEKFYGLRKEWIEQTPITITDKEKTIIDCLDKPYHSGGIREVAKALKIGELKHQQLKDYALRIGNYAVIRRLGFLYDQMGIQLNLPPPRSKEYLLLDPTMTSAGHKDPKWRLIINLDRFLVDVNDSH
jgi:predicted transcriptional regulator of viral defense system